MGPPKSHLATPLAALAALLPEASGRPQLQVLLDVGKRLQAEEAEALGDFGAAARVCIGKLSSDTLAALREAAKAIAAGDDAQDSNTPQCLVGQNSVAKMFQQFDANGDGRLSKSQFKEMLVTLGLTEHFSDQEISSLVGAADINSDGCIDLHEFTEWLYAGADGLGAKPMEDDLEEQEAVSIADERQRIEDNLRRQLIQARSSLEAVEQQLAEANKAHELASRRAEEHYEEELENAHQFWRAIADSSATNKLGQVVDLDAATMLGHGKYGYILKSKRRSDGAVSVVKLLSLRWAHVAASEWGKAKAAADHPNIVEYADVLLHADDDKAIHNILSAAREAGRLQTRVRRDNFPKNYVCLMQEFMNAGTIQDWTERQILPPGGLLVTMQTVASALAHMHARGLTHNDIKPENILLSQLDESDAHSAVTVKLADLGLAKKSNDRTDDFWQYGMTVLCMTTGEKFGERKYQPGSHEQYVEMVAACIPRESSGILATLGRLPDLLRRVFAKDISMREVSDMEMLQGWNFFDGELPAAATEMDEDMASGVQIGRRIRAERIFSVHKLSARRSTRALGETLDS